MKPFTLLLLAFTLLLWTGCKDDQPTASAPILNYDGPNVSAPQLPPGRNLYAAYFPPAETAPYAGRRLDRIRFYLTQIPQATSIVVFDQGADERTPGTELYRQNLTNRINTTEWIDYAILDEDIEITDRGIWLAVEVELAGNSQNFAVGCDAGRSYDPNGDLLLLSNTTQWTSFQAINGERVNWNIRGVLSEG